MNAPTPRPGPVLVVDDDRLVLLTLSHGLRQAGFEVLEADNGDDAILMARRHQPRLALLDIRMQGLSGFDVAQYLQDYSHTPFMFLSAYADDAVRAQARALGAVQCLTKPIDMARLLPLVEDALAQAGGRVHAVAGAHEGGQDMEASADAQSAPESALSLEAVAVGVIMHRHGLNRAQALLRLHALAATAAQSQQQTAQALVLAQETLASTGALPAR